MPRNNDLWIKFRGIKSIDLHLKVINMPDRFGASERGTSVQILGRNGDVFISDESLASIPMTCVFRMMPGASRSDISRWLTGSGDMVLSDDPDYFIKARVSENVHFSRAVIDGCVMDIVTATFNADPFKYSIDGSDALDDIYDAGFIYNPGNASSLPLITVYGNGNINLMIGQYTLLLTGVSEYITIDTDAKIAFKGDANHSSKITLVNDEDLWPELIPGNNSINWAGNVTRISIIPNWRWR